MAATTNQTYLTLLGQIYRNWAKICCISSWKGFVTDNLSTSWIHKNELSVSKISPEIQNRFELNLRKVIIGCTWKLINFWTQPNLKCLPQQTVVRRLKISYNLAHFIQYCTKIWSGSSWASSPTSTLSTTHDTTSLLENLALVVEVNLLCLLAKYLNNHWLDFSETLRT